MTYRNKNGKFCTEQEYYENFFGNCNYSQLEMSFTKDEDLVTAVSKKDTYTLCVKVEAFYDVNVQASSFEEAMSKVKSLDSYTLLTETIPVDCKESELTAILKQDS